MRKKVNLAILGMIVFIAGINVYESNSYMKLSDLMLSNIEALANDEGDAPSGCYATICDKTCKKGGKVYSYQSASDCGCSLCN